MMFGKVPDLVQCSSKVGASVYLCTCWTVSIETLWFVFDGRCTWLSGDLSEGFELVGMREWFELGCACEWFELGCVCGWFELGCVCEWLKSGCVWVLVVWWLTVLLRWRCVCCGPGDGEGSGGNHGRAGETMAAPSVRARRAPRQDRSGLVWKDDFGALLRAGRQATYKALFNVTCVVQNETSITTLQQDKQNKTNTDFEQQCKWPTSYQQ